MRRITRHCQCHLSAADLTGAQFSNLVLLDERVQATMTELAKRLGLERATLLHVLKPLQRDQLIATRRSVADARQLTLSLSAAGQRKLREAARLWQAAQTEFETRAGSEHTARLRRILLALTWRVGPTWRLVFGGAAELARRGIVARGRAISVATRGPVARLTPVCPAEILRNQSRGLLHC